jgi:hypothetical protein
VPTKHRRHAITETPDVAAKLAPLRRALGTDRVPMSELVMLGAEAKLAQLRGMDADVEARRRAFTDRIRRREIEVDPVAADEVRRRGWVRPLD